MNTFERLENNEGLDTKAEFGELFASVSEAIEEGRQLDDFSKAREQLEGLEAKAALLTNPEDQELKEQILSLVEDYRKVITP